MVKKRLKVPRTEAIAKIENQLEKADILLAEAKSISRDNFEVKVKHWVDFTIEALKEIFESSSFAYEFKEHRSSEVTYVSSTWIPDIKYYVSKQIIPKMEYLKILKENIPNFEEYVAEQQVQSSLNPWPVIRGFLLRLSSYEVPAIIDRAGLTVDWNLTVKENFSNKMRLAAYRPRIDAAHLSLPSDDDRLRVAFIVAREIASRGTTDELNDALREIGWELCSNRLTPSDGSVRQLFFPERSQHDAYVEIRAILQKGVKSAVIVDPYMDHSILTLLSTSAKPGMTIHLLTSKLSSDFSLEAKKWLSQHVATTLEVRTAKEFHDRFIVLDDSLCWHIGCSIKDAGNKAFMLSELEDDQNREALLKQINKSWATGIIVL